VAIKIFFLTQYFRNNGLSFPFNKFFTEKDRVVITGSSYIQQGRQEVDIKDVYISVQRSSASIFVPVNILFREKTSWQECTNSPFKCRLWWCTSLVPEKVSYPHARKKSFKQNIIIKSNLWFQQSEKASKSWRAMMMMEGVLVRLQVSALVPGCQRLEINFLWNFGQFDHVCLRKKASYLNKKSMGWVRSTRPMSWLKKKAQNIKISYNW